MVILKFFWVPQVFFYFIMFNFVKILLKFFVETKNMKKSVWNYCVKYIFQKLLCVSVLKGNKRISTKSLRILAW